MSAWTDGLEDAARGILSEPVYRYFAQGAGRGDTAAEAIDAWRALRFRPHSLVDVSEVDLSTSALGTALPAPLGIAPTTLQRQADPAGEIAMCEAASEAGALVVVSSNAGSRYVDITATGVTWWAQVYVLRDRRLTESMLEAAVSGGASALVLTVDTPGVGTKDDHGMPSVWDQVPDEHLHTNIDTGGRRHRDLTKAADVTGGTIRWLRERTGLPVVVKGVLRGDDARTAVTAGAAGVWVSNHGGRQLDRAIATCHALPEVVAAVGADAEVYVDGGLRDGGDLLAALALGARVAFVGRPSLWALTVHGQGGVTRLLHVLRTELTEALMLAGVPAAAAVPDDLVVPQTGSPR